MTTPTPECPACRVTMQAGFVIDSDHDGRAGRAQWAEGRPERGFLHRVKVQGRKLDTITFRCPRCGWLIWFAPEAKDAEA